jgi:hypothetical protein
MKFRSNRDKLLAEISQPIAEHFQALSEFDPKVNLAYTSLADWTSVTIAQVEDTLINERFRPTTAAWICSRTKVNHAKHCRVRSPAEPFRGRPLGRAIRGRLIWGRCPFLVPSLGGQNRKRLSGLRMRLLILCRVAFPRPRPRRVSGLGATRFAERPYAVHKLPRPLHHKWYKARIVSVPG